MKRTFRDDDRHASISSQTWSDFPRLSLRGRTFLTITCATGMAIDQPCKSNNSVPSNVLSLLFYFLFFLLRYLWIASLHYQLLKNSNTSTISIREISWKFFFPSSYIHILNSIAFCIADDRKIYYLKTCSTYNYYFHLKKRRSRDLSDLHSILQLSYFIENFDIISHRVPAIPIERSSSRSRKWFWPGAPLDPSLRATEQLPEFYCPSSPCESKNKETTVNRVTYVPSPPVSTSKYVTLLSTVTDPRHLKHADEEGEKKKKENRKEKEKTMFDCLEFIR